MDSVRPHAPEDINAFPDTPVPDLKPFVPGMNPEHADVPDWVRRVSENQPD